MTSLHKVLISFHREYLLCIYNPGIENTKELVKKELVLVKKKKQSANEGFEALQ